MLDDHRKYSDDMTTRSNKMHRTNNIQCACRDSILYNTRAIIKYSGEKKIDSLYLANIQGIRGSSLHMKTFGYWLFLFRNKQLLECF